MCFVNKIPPDILWHYTSTSGLLGIWNSGTIWASDLRFLNDASENTRLKDLLLQQMKARGDQEYEQFNSWLESLKAKDAENTFLYELVSRARYDELSSAVNDALQHFNSSDTFVTCFSAKSDSLTQWRAYGGSGPGYAIGFKSCYLSELITPSQSTHPGDPNELRSFDAITYVKDKDDPALAERINILIWTLMSISSTAMYGALTDISPFIKDAAFSSEEEWRLCHRYSAVKHTISFRSGLSHVVPYIEIPIAREAIKEIVVGPGPSQALNIHSVEIMRKARGLTFEVTASNVPFRNW